jgi:hypothetical protein
MFLLTRSRAVQEDVLAFNRNEPVFVSLVAQGLRWCLVVSEYTEHNMNEKFGALTPRRGVPLYVRTFSGVSPSMQ